MRHRVLALALMSLLGASCSGDSSDAEPIDVAERLLSAVAEGDNDAFVSVHAPGAVYTFPDGASIELFGPLQADIDDFDGDGVITLGDDFQARQAFHPFGNHTLTWSCAAIDETQVACTGETIDDFIRSEGGPPLVTETLLTVIDGLVTEQQFMPPTDSAAFSATMDASDRGWTAYEAWVQKTYPEEYPALFRAPCCTGDVIRTPDTVRRHGTLIAEFFG